MKNLFLILLLAASFVGCDKEVVTFKIDPNAMITIKAASGVRQRAVGINFLGAMIDTTHLTALEIVKQTGIISFTDTLMNPYLTPGRSFASEQRDTISSTPKLLMWATDVISLTGELQTGFIGNFLQAKDVVFVRYLLPNFQGADTIAYIPNSVVRAAETAIKAAYAAKDIEACYNIFNTAYSFTPITGIEWRALKALNQE